MKTKAIFNLIVEIVMIIYALVYGFGVFSSAFSIQNIFSSRNFISIALFLLHIFIIFCAVKFLRMRPNDSHGQKLEKVVRAQFKATIFILLGVIYSIAAIYLFPRDLGLAFGLAVFYILPAMILYIISLIFGIRSVILFFKKDSSPVANGYPPSGGVSG